MHAGITPTEYYEHRGQCEVEAESVVHVVAGILDSTPAPTASATSPDGPRETPNSSDRAPAVYWPPRTGSPKLSSRTPLISSNSANRANSMKGTNRTNSKNKPGRRPTSRRPDLSRLRCSRGLTDDGFYLAGWWTFLSLSGWSRLAVVVLKAIYWHWVFPGSAPSVRSIMTSC